MLHVSKRVLALLLIVLLVCTTTTVPSAAPSSVLTLSSDFLMVAVGAGAVPLTASLPDVTWGTSNYLIAQYNPYQGGVTSSMNGGYATISATVGNQVALCRVCSYYNNTPSNGTFFIQSSSSDRFLSPDATPSQRNFDSNSQGWSVYATSDGYFTLFSMSQFYYLAYDTSGATPALSRGYDPGLDTVKWIIKAVNIDDIDTIQYVLIPKALEDEGYMLAIDSSDNIDGGALTLTKWASNTYFRCKWSFYDASQYKGTVSDWRTGTTTVSFFRDEISIQLVVDPDYVDQTLANNFYLGNTIATMQWRLALNTPITTGSSNPDIVCYYVTRDSYYQLTGASWSHNVAGTTTRALDVEAGYLLTEGSLERINVYETTELVTIYILCNENPSFVQAVYTHELGHAVGYDQHLNNIAYIMYSTIDPPASSTATYNCAIHEDEAHDLRIIYDMFS